MSWLFWLSFGGFGIASLACFARAYAHLTDEARSPGSRLPMRGSLIRQNIFTERGWRLRIFGWAFAGLALLVLVIAGIAERRAARENSAGPSIEQSR